MNTNEQTAKYICDNQERLQMALHVHEAMPDVRKQLIKGVFEAVGEQVTKKLKLDRHEAWDVECYDKSVYFYTEETGDSWVFAWAKPGKAPKLQLVAGVYEDELNKAKLDDIRECFRTNSDLETWSDGEILSDTDGVYANVHQVDARWDQDNFLRRAILNHDEVVSEVAELLLKIYEGIFER